MAVSLPWCGTTAAGLQPTLKNSAAAPRTCEGAAGGILAAARRHRHLALVPVMCGVSHRSVDSWEHVGLLQTVSGCPLVEAAVVACPCCGRRRQPGDAHAQAAALPAPHAALPT